MDAIQRLGAVPARLLGWPWTPANARPTAAADLRHHHRFLVLLSLPRTRAEDGPGAGPVAQDGLREMAGSWFAGIKHGGDVPWPPRAHHDPARPARGSSRYPRTGH